MNALRCDECGRFVPYKDLDSGRATHREVTPDSAYTSETWETICASCNDRCKAPTRDGEGIA